MLQQIASCWYNVTESECCNATTDCIVLVQRDWEWVLQCYNRLHRAGTTWLRVSAAMQQQIASCWYNVTESECCNAATDCIVLVQRDWEWVLQCSNRLHRAGTTWLRVSAAMQQQIASCWYNVTESECCNATTDCIVLVQRDWEWVLQCYNRLHRAGTTWLRVSAAMLQQIASCWYNVTESECCNAATDCIVLVQRDWEWVLQCSNRLHRAGTTWLRVSAAMQQQIASCWYNVTESECCNAATDCIVLVQRDWEWVLQCYNRLHRAGTTWLRVSAAMQQQIATCWYNVTESECCNAATDCNVLVQRDWEWVLQFSNRLQRAGTTWLRVSAAMQQQIATCWYNVTESECCNATTDCIVLVQRDWEWVLQCSNRLQRAGTTWLRVSAAMQQQIVTCWYNVTESEWCNATTDCIVLVQRDWEWVLQCSNRLQRAGTTWLRVSAAMQQQIVTSWYNLT